MRFSQPTENFLIQKLNKELNNSIASLQSENVGGGSINRTYRVTTDHRHTFFLKINSLARYPGLFEKEKNGLQFLAKYNCVKTPAVIFYDAFNNEQFLLLEWIQQGPGTDSFWKQFGEQLARLHQCSYEQFGLAEDNYMGALPQLNDFTGSWVEFFITKRLQPQIALAAQKKLLPDKEADLFQKLFKKLDTIFKEEKPSLLHGDLWNGNFICNERSEPVLIDPAVYFGHRSMDIGMTTLFGGFDKAFYDSYNYHFPLPSNYHEQWEICNLYPLLIHLNLFGQSYLHDVVSTLKRFS